MHPAQKALAKIVSSVDLPPGIGSFDPAWELVSEEDRALCAAVDACIHEDTEENREDVRNAGRAWKRAWVLAIERYRSR